MKRTKLVHVCLTTGPLLVAIAGCGETAKIPLVEVEYKQVPLVANSMLLEAAQHDPNLMNAWGIGVDPAGNVWVAANHSGRAIGYDMAGNLVGGPVSVPSPTAGVAGAPSGLVYNTTTGFLVAGGAPAKVILSTEDGTILAWNSGDAAVIMVDKSAEDAVYKGLALAENNGAPFIYATNFKQHTVDVFDTNFTQVTTMAFADPSMPTDFSPFGIQTIGEKIFVTYAKPKAPDFMDDEANLGNGYVNIFTTAGVLTKRFASQGKLNSPWGVTRVHDNEFGGFLDAILIGNFGDGRIHAFETNEGEEIGTLENKKDVPLEINGLWGLNLRPGEKHERMIFSAGPNAEADGLFGLVEPR